MELSRGEGYRPWAELIPDALVLIFKKMSFQEILTVLPAVCKSWKKATTQPDCWQEIDIKDWCVGCRMENRERMVEMLVSLSRGSMRKLSVYGLQNDSIFAFIAGCAHILQTLRMPMSRVTDSIVIQMAPKLATVTYLDISYCEKITSSSLEALGKHCKFLTRLTRNMNPQVAKSPEDDEAFAIAKYMCRLKHLALVYGLLTDIGMEAILSMCKELEHLDILGCCHVVMKGSLVEQCEKLKFFVGPVVNYADRYDLLDYLSYDDEYDSLSDYDYHYYPSLYDDDIFDPDEGWQGNEKDL